MAQIILIVGVGFAGVRGAPGAARVLDGAGVRNRRCRPSRLMCAAQSVPTGLAHVQRIAFVSLAFGGVRPMLKNHPMHGNQQAASKGLVVDKRGKS
jgi:hypothetical protein